MKSRTFDERALFFSDPHAKFQDNIAVDVALQFARFWKPHYLFLMGDVIDFYSIARFDNDPRRKLDIQTEIDAARELLVTIRQAVGADCHIYYIEGNHEYRISKFLWSKAPELAHLRSLNLPGLLELKDLGIKYVSKGKMEYHGFVIKHGHLIRKRSGYAAHAELDAVGKSGASGHTHRLGQVYRTDTTGSYTWVETGCLCDLSPEWCEGKTMDWQHGFAYGMFRKHDDRFVVHTLPIVKGSVIFGEREIKTKLPLPRPRRRADIVI
jgi:hypothetical protein